MTIFVLSLKQNIQVACRNLRVVKKHSSYSKARIPKPFFPEMCKSSNKSSGTWNIQCVFEESVKTITSDKKVWVDTMMTEELGLNEDPKSPVMKGWVTFLSFVSIGFIPLIPYLLGLFIDSIQEMQYPLSVGMTFVTFFLIGSAKTYVTGKSWWRSGVETLLVGALAAVAAYAVGYFLRGLA